MKLYELAYACRLYREVTQFDLSYADVCKALGASPDLSSQTQQDALLRFLIRMAMGAKPLRDLVDLVGIEPTTSSMPWKRAPSCATGPLEVAGSILA